MKSKNWLLLALLVGCVGHHQIRAQWVTVTDGTDFSDEGRSVVVDSAGHLYTTGYFSYVAVTFGAGADSLVLTNRGGSDIFIVKHNPDGSPQWAASAGGSANATDERGHSVAVDAAGNVYVLGQYVDAARLPSGTYVYRAEGETFTTVGKTILLR